MTETAPRMSVNAASQGASAPRISQPVYARLQFEPTVADTAPESGNRAAVEPFLRAMFGSMYSENVILAVSVEPFHRGVSLGETVLVNLAVQDGATSVFRSRLMTPWMRVGSGDAYEYIVRVRYSNRPKIEVDGAVQGAAAALSMIAAGPTSGLTMVSNALASPALATITGEAAQRLNSAFEDRATSTERTALGPAIPAPDAPGQFLRAHRIDVRGSNDAGIAAIRAVMTFASTLGAPEASDMPPAPGSGISAEPLMQSIDVPDPQARRARKLEEAVGVEPSFVKLQVTLEGDADARRIQGACAEAAATLRNRYGLLPGDVTRALFEFVQTRGRSERGTDATTACFDDAQRLLLAKAGLIQGGGATDADPPTPSR